MDHRNDERLVLFHKTSDSAGQRRNAVHYGLKHRLHGLAQGQGRALDRRHGNPHRPAQAGVHLCGSLGGRAFGVSQLVGQASDPVGRLRQHVSRRDAEEAEGLGHFLRTLGHRHVLRGGVDLVQDLYERLEVAGRVCVGHAEEFL